MKFLNGLLIVIIIMGCGKNEDKNPSSVKITNSLVKIITHKELINVEPADLSIYKNNGIELKLKNVNSRTLSYAASNDSCDVTVEFEKNESFSVKHLKTNIQLKNRDIAYFNSLKNQINASFGKTGQEFLLDNTKNYIWKLNSAHNVSLTWHTGKSENFIKMNLSNSNIDNGGV